MSILSCQTYGKVLCTFVLPAFLFIGLKPVAAEENYRSNGHGHTNQSTVFTITRSVWNADESRLEIDGEGAGKRKTVTIEYAATSDTIGTTLSNRDGSFTFVKSGIQLASCDIVAIRYDGQHQSISVCTDSDTGSNDSGSPPTDNGGYTVLAWNDLGMHCMDGVDYSIFSILPPYNNLHAQLINKDGTSQKLVTDGVTLTYEAWAYADGVINTTSATPTNFWDFVSYLYEPLFGPVPGVDIGLLGNPTQSLVPAPMSFNSTYSWWEAEGIPTDPYDDDGAKNFYPEVKVVARDSAGTVLASTTTVLPVSDEMDCRKCHGSGSDPAAQPAGGWVFNADEDKDYKLNILRRHDEKHDITGLLDALDMKGYVYKTELYDTAMSGTPVLCSSCHGTNALPGTGIDGVKPLTEALHGFHAAVVDPSTGQSLDNSDNRSSCYSCHPGQDTQCLRGAMGAAVNSDGTSMMACQSCHGTMSDVGISGRTGWLMEPTCQGCHYNGQRSLSVQSVTNQWDTRFATNPDTPMTGYDLFRFSKGHGGLQCEACHGATHAIYPSAEPGDNAQSLAVQGHTGTIAECIVCHSTAPSTTNTGPHGLHTVGQDWVVRHEHAASGDRTQCASCHGSDYRGSVISKVSMARTFSVESRTVDFPEGHPVSCYDCHNGPGGGD